MTSSSSPALERGLDTAVVVYGLLPHAHPAAVPCERFLATHSGWFTSPLVLFEAKNVLTRAYGVDPGAVTQKLSQFAAGPVVLLDVDAAATAPVLQLADAHG